MGNGSSVLSVFTSEFNWMLSLMRQLSKTKHDAIQRDMILVDAESEPCSGPSDE